MRIIKYYDRIHKQLLELEVSDEVAKFFHADNRRWSRQGQKIKENIALSLDDPTECNGEEALTYGELIEDEKANIDKIMAKKELARIVWNVVDILDKNQAKMIKLYYIYGYRAKELANYFGLTRSAFTQWKDTTHKHLLYLLSRDDEFNKTDYYYKDIYKSFADEVIDTAKQKLSQSQISINLNKVNELMNDVTQAMKIADKLGVGLPEENKKMLDFMTKTVRGFVKPLLKKENDKSKQEDKNKDKEENKDKRKTEKKDKFLLFSLEDILDLINK